MSFRQAENIVRIEGILSETEIKYGSFERNGQPVETIGGTIKVLVEQEIGGKKADIEIPVYLFSTKYTKKGTLNPSYTSIETVMKDFVSVAATGSKAQADKIRISNAQIRMNEFPSAADGTIISQPRIQASFVSKAIGDFHPGATFNLEFMVSSMHRETDREGVELDPARLAIQVIVPQFTQPDADTINVDLVPLVATSESVINAIESYWEAGSCYKASGRVNFSSRTEEVIEEVDFGEPQKRIRTITVNDLIVTGGSQAPLEGDFAWDLEEIKAGMAARKAHLEEMKNKNIQKRTPAKESTQGKKDLGF